MGETGAIEDEPRCGEVLDGGCPFWLVRGRQLGHSQLDDGRREGRCRVSKRDREMGELRGERRSW